MCIFSHFSEFRIFRIQNLHARMHDCNMLVTLYARHVSYSRRGVVQQRFVQYPKMGLTRYPEVVIPLKPPTARNNVVRANVRCEPVRATPRVMARWNRIAPTLLGPAKHIFRRKKEASNNHRSTAQQAQQQEHLFQGR